jgi:hypothetical protein
MININTTTQVVRITGTGHAVTVSITAAPRIIVQGATVALPNYELYQRKITVSATEPVGAVEGDLWLDIS